MELMDPNSRCAKYYIFATDIENVVVRNWLLQMFPNDPDEEIAIFNPTMQWSETTYLVLMITEALGSVVILAMLAINSWKYGIK